MSIVEYLIDTNILIYHTKGSQRAMDEDIANKAIELRRKTGIKLADAVIAATAIMHNLKLVTRNVDDFKGIEGLEVINPFIPSRCLLSAIMHLHNSLREEIKGSCQE